jgi:opacity protein-like surface antigen
VRIVLNADIKGGVMKSARTWIATAFMIASGVAPAMAADWGGVKNMGTGVPIPVPAPAPVPTYDADSDWYIGLSLGADLLTDATIRDSDVDYLGNSNPGHFARSSSDVPSQMTYGLTFGRYMTPSLRWEVAIDYSPDTQISRDETLFYPATNSAHNFSDGSIDTNLYNVRRTDNVQLSRTTALFNLLYDIPTGTRFTPYIGGGLGLTWRRLRRGYSETSSCINSINSDVGIPTGACSGNPNLPSGGTLSGSDSKNQVDLAAAVQAGIATNLTDQIIWDNGWQMLWEGGKISMSAPSAAGNNEFTFKDSVLQQFRSGIRIKFD